METFYTEPNAVLYQGDALDALLEMEPESVHCVVTSPPYYGLRAYSGDQSRTWGGDAACSHQWEEAVRAPTKLAARDCNTNGVYGDGLVDMGKVYATVERPPASRLCAICGAREGPLGLEPQVDCLGWARGERCSRCYICHLLAVMDGLWRVLRKDGTVWWVLGDTYAGSWGNYHPTGMGGQRPKATERFRRAARGDRSFLAVAKRLGRRGVGIEIAKGYCALAQKRIEAVTARMV